MPSRRAIARELRRAAIGVLSVAAMAYLAACAVFALFEPKFVFAQVHRQRTAPEAAGLAGFSAVTIRTEDGVPLDGWWAPPKPGHGTIVVLTGSGVVMADYAGLFGDLSAHGFGVVSIDYRGNGASPGTPSEAGWRADARAAFDFAHAAAPEAKIAVFGQSMGTGLAVGLAADRPVTGVLLDSAYASLVRLFAINGVPVFGHLPMPLRLLMRDPLDSEALIGKLHVPVMILHGTADGVIPIGEARRLYAAAHEPKTLIEVEGAEHAGVRSGAPRQRALAALAAWTKP